MHLGWREVERLIGREGFTACQVLTNSECAPAVAGVRARVLRSAPERRRILTAGQGPETVPELA